MQTPPPKDNSKLALSLIGVVLGMVMLAYASVPLYQLFCQVTGFGGTTGVASKDQVAAVLTNAPEITVRFESNIDKNLRWRFKPNQREVKVRIGENKLISYLAENLSDEPLTGTATYNVTPHAAGVYFNKIQCFCFTKQTLHAGQKVDMPVSFFIDPEILNDKDLKGISNITLSYTFFNVETANSL